MGQNFLLHHIALAGAGITYALCALNGYNIHGVHDRSGAKHS